jgi:hypothetical protein
MIRPRPKGPDYLDLTMNITIHRNEGGAFFVLHGDRHADQLTYEEMLGLVAQIAAPSAPRALSWLKTASEWREDARRSAERMERARRENIAAGADEPQSPTDLPTATEIADAWQATGLSPAALREETIAIAVAQDGADAEVERDMADDRIVADWSAPADLSPINRADVRLKVGDVVVLRNDTGPFAVGLNGGDFDDPGRYPFRVDGETYTAEGAFIADGPHDANYDIVSVNGRPIIDAEEV